MNDLCDKDVPQRTQGIRNGACAFFFSACLCGEVCVPAALFAMQRWRPGLVTPLELLGIGVAFNQKLFVRDVYVDFQSRIVLDQQPHHFFVAR